MLGEDIYQKIINLQQEFLQLQSIPKVNFTYAKRTMDLIDRYLGYHHILMAHMDNIRKPLLRPNFQMHNVSTDFAERIYLASKKDPSVFQISPATDAWILSQTPKYKGGLLFKQVFQSSGYTDCYLQFIRMPGTGEYLSYIMFFSTKGTFTDTDIKIIQMIKNSIAIAFSNSLVVWNIETNFTLLQKCISSLPIGIMMIEGMNTVSYTNKVAQQYLRELGVTDPQFYTTFYINNIFPYYQNDVFAYRNTRPVRIKSFLFNIVSLSNDALALDHMFQMQETKSGWLARDVIETFRNIVSCVYIIADETTHAVAVEDFYEKIGLSKRERDVAACIIEGLNNNEIAEKLVLSFNTVKIHVSNILRKAGVISRLEFINKAYGYNI